MGIHKTVFHDALKRVHWNAIERLVGEHGANKHATESRSCIIVWRHEVAIGSRPRRWIFSAWTRAGTSSWIESGSRVSNRRGRLRRWGTAAFLRHGTCQYPSAAGLRPCPPGNAKTARARSGVQGQSPCGGGVVASAPASDRCCPPSDRSARPDDHARRCGGTRRGARSRPCRANTFIRAQQSGAEELNRTAVRRVRIRL